MSLVQAASQIDAQWSVIAVQELDAGVKTSATWATQDGHRVEKYHPGEGSLPLAYIFHRIIASSTPPVAWQGRCGRALIRTSAERQDLAIVNIHGAHGDDFEESLQDLLQLCRSRPAQSRIVIVGDTNVDMLPALAQDLYAHRPDRSMCGQVRRSQLEHIASQLRIRCHVPSVTLGCPAERWASTLSKHL